MVRHRLLPAPSAPPASPAGASRSLAIPRSEPTLDNDGLSGWNNASDNSQHLRNVPINILLRLQPCPSVPSLPAQCVERRSDIIMASLHHSSVRLSDLDPLTEWDLAHLLKLGDTLESIPAYRYSASEFLSQARDTLFHSSFHVSPTCPESYPLSAPGEFCTIR